MLQGTMKKHVTMKSDNRMYTQELAKDSCKHYKNLRFPFGTPAHLDMQVVPW